MINYDRLCSNIAVELAKWAFDLKHTYSNKKERLQAIKLFKLVNKYEKRYRKKHKFTYIEEAGKPVNIIIYHSKLRNMGED